MTSRRATIADVERICLSLPETELGTTWGDRPTYVVRQKTQAPRLRALSCPSSRRGRPGDRGGVRRPAGDPDSRAAEKAALVEADGPFFTIDHFRNFNAVLVRQSRLGEVDVDELTEVITDAWLAVAPKRLVKEFLA
jgi:hypothetical protein